MLHMPLWHTLLRCCRLSGAAGDEELDSKMAGVLVLRCLQAYQQGAGA
jgi:hypothetical protein